jgi:hypothetical protein
MFDREADGGKARAVSGALWEEGLKRGEGGGGKGGRGVDAADPDLLHLV